MRRAFVIGWPISHSLSPFLHGHWLTRHGIDGRYEAIAVPPDELGGFLANLSQASLVGGNVTIPHKQAALAACGRIDSEARAIGAVNTLWLEDNVLCGSNTDAYGFSANLDRNAPLWREAETALVLGAGGASRAIIHAVLEAGLKVHLVNRTLARAEAIADEFGPRVTAGGWDAIPALLPDSGLIVNATSLGMTGQPPLNIELKRADKRAIVTDIVYNPLETKLLEQAGDRGMKTVDGLGMLMHQAVPGFEKWFGIRPEVDADLRADLLQRF